MKSKKVSAIIPCFNSEQWVRRCVNALLQQTMDKADIEIILVDDCSTDDTWNVLCALESEHPANSIIVIKAEEHMGPGGARNLALAYASATYVAMIDSDDWVAPEYFEKMYGAAVAYNCDIVCCNAVRDLGDGRRIPIPYHTGNELLIIESLDRRKEVLLSGCLRGRMLVRTQYLLDNQIFYPNGIVYEDICWNALNYCYMERIYVMQDFLYYYFLNTKSVVMKPKQEYAHDLFAANYIKWDVLVTRGFYEQMSLEIEFDTLITFYLMVLKMYKLRFDTIPSKSFMEMQKFIKGHMPNYKSNPYIGTLLSEEQRELLGFIDMPMGEDELKLLHSALVQMQGI